MRIPRFFLGTHLPNWLWDERFREIPLFISRRRLMRYRRLRPSVTSWALDSGGFTELQKFGHWTIGPREYAVEVRRFRDEIGCLEWAAIQDWMCEPAVIAGGSFKGGTFVGTKLSVKEHQRRTVQSYLDLMSIAPDLPWTPVVQGWKLDDYLDHVDQYLAVGVDLSTLPVVGVGSVCRRENTDEAEDLMHTLKLQARIRSHGFGFKAGGLLRCVRYLESADSLAWSFNARRDEPLPGCDHQNCANCPLYAIRWRDRLMDRLNRKATGKVQGRLF